MDNQTTAPKAAEALARVIAAVPQTVAVGSRVTCDPPPQGTDADYLVHVLDSQASALWAAVRDDGWEFGGSITSDDLNLIPPQDRFQSYKLDDLNLIITQSQSFAHRFLAATSIAKRLNLLDKADRIALFQAVLCGRIDVEVPTFSPEMEIAF